MRRGFLLPKIFFIKKSKGCLNAKPVWKKFWGGRFLRIVATVVLVGIFCGFLMQIRSLQVVKNGILKNDKK